MRCREPGHRHYGREPEQQPFTSRWIIAAILDYSCGILIYVLSIGPVIKSNLINPTLVDTIYKPLELLTHWDPFNKFMGWYLEIWGPF